MKEKVSIIIAVLALMGVATVFVLQLSLRGIVQDTAIEQQTVTENSQQATDSGANQNAGNERPGTASLPGPVDTGREPHPDITESSIIQPEGRDVPQLSEDPTREELFALKRQRQMERAIETGTLSEFLEAEAALERERSQREEQRRFRLDERRRNREMRKAGRSRHMTDR